MEKVKNKIKIMVQLLLELLQTEGEQDIGDYLQFIRKIFRDESEKRLLKTELENVIGELEVYHQIYVYSFLIDFLKDADCANQLARIAIESNLKTEERYFLFNQLKRLSFLGVYQTGWMEKKNLYQLFEKCVKQFRNMVYENAFERQEKNTGLVLVITTQFLGTMHAPTKTALGRCAALIKMGKKVLLINTAEQLPNNGKMPYWDPAFGMYMKDLTNCESITWENIKIPFFQCDNNMPNLEVIKYLLEIVRQLQPEFAVQIGSDSIFASLVNDMIPVLTIGTVFSEITPCLTDYQTLGRTLTEEDEQYLKEIGRPRECIISHKFTTELVKQESVLKRQDLQIEETEFVLLVVGARLDYEVSDEFLEMLDRLVKKENISVMFLGQFTKKLYIERLYPELAKRIYCVGMQKDVLAYMELCNLYVNPIRTGGGMSCVEAMFKGLPVVTVGSGDVSVNAGEVFFTKDYNTMEDLITRYKKDRLFYEIQSQKAKDRAKELTDTEAGFKEVVYEFLQRVKGNR